MRATSLAHAPADDGKPSGQNDTTRPEVLSRLKLRNSYWNNVSCLARSFNHRMQVNDQRHLGSRPAPERNEDFHARWSFSEPAKLAAMHQRNRPRAQIEPGQGR